MILFKIYSQIYKDNIWTLAPPFIRQHPSYDDCLEDKREDCQICALLCNTIDVYNHTHIDMSSSYRWAVLGLGFRVFFVFYYDQFVCVSVSYFVFCVFPVYYCLFVSTSAIDYLERLVSEITCYVSSGTLNPTHSLTMSEEFWAQMTDELDNVVLTLH